MCAIFDGDPHRSFAGEVLGKRFRIRSQMPLFDNIPLSI
jgi:hypothetical protein